MRFLKIFFIFVSKVLLQSEHKDDPEKDYLLPPSAPNDDFLTLYKDDSESERQDTHPAPSPLGVEPSAPQDDLSSDGSIADDGKEDDSTASIKSDN